MTGKVELEVRVARSAVRWTISIKTVKVLLLTRRSLLLMEMVLLHGKTVMTMKSLFLPLVSSHDRTTAQHDFGQAAGGPRAVGRTLCNFETVLHSTHRTYHTPQTRES